MKKKKTTQRGLAMYIVAITLFVLAFGGVAAAQSSGSFLDILADKIVERLLGGGGEMGDGMLGASNYPVHYVPDYVNGIYAGGVAVIDSSGNWDGAITGTTGTFSSTLRVTGAATLSSTLGVTGISTFTANINANGSDNRLATSTFSGLTAVHNNLRIGTIGSEKLFVNVSASQVMINTSTAAGTLTVTSGSTATSSAAIGGAASPGCFAIGNAAGGITYMTVNTGGDWVTSTPSCS